MANYETEVRIKTTVDNSGLKKGTEEIEKSLDDAEKKAESKKIAPKWSKENAKKAEEQIDRILAKKKKAQEEPISAGVETETRTADYDWRASVEQSARINQEIEASMQTMDQSASKAQETQEHYNQLRIDVEEYAKSLKQLEEQGMYFGDEEYDQIYIAWKNADDAVKEYARTLNTQTTKGQAEEAEKVARAAEKQAAQQAKAAEQAARAKAKEEEQQRRIEEAAERNLQRENQRLEAQARAEARQQERAAKEQEAQAKLAAQQQAEQAEQEHLESIRSQAVVSNQNMVDLLREQESLESRIAELKKAGVTEGYQEYDQIQSRLAEIKTQIDEERKGFGEAEKAARGFHSTLQKGTKKSSGILKTLTDKLKKIAVGMLVFNQIKKGFDAMMSAMKEGFKNIAQYSSEYNTAMSDMQSSAAQLKNGLAAAFEPIVTMAIPYITKLLNWLNKAIEKVGQFLAALSGRTTYTRAKQQMIDYAESIDSTAKSAKRALAPFDQLNVIAKQDTSSSGSGGELTGADAFETVEIDDGVLAAAEKVKEVLKAILPIVEAIGIAFAAWKIISILDQLSKLDSKLGKVMLAIILIAALAGAVYFYLNMWNNGVDWKGIIGYIAMVALAAGAALILIGPLAFGIILLVAGIAGLILAIKDICENGLTAENVTLLVISAIMILIGVFVIFGGVAAIVVGAIMLVVAAIAAVVIWAGNGEECLESLKNQFGALGDFVKHVFAGDFESAFDDIKKYLLYFANTTNILTESFVNLAIAGINKLLGGLNKLFGTDWHIDEWQAPTLKAMNKKASTSSVNAGKIPKLADGAVIQGGRPFAAILGDQRVGQTNIEAPLDTLVEAMMRANKETGGSGGTYVFTAQLNSREIFRETVRQNQMYKKSTGGKSAFA